MKTRRVKIHSKEWFEENCDIDEHKSYINKSGEFPMVSKMFSLFGKEVDIYLDNYGRWLVDIQSNDYYIEDWMIEKEITATDDFFDDFITYIKDTPKAQLMEEWSKHEKWDEVGPTIKEFMNNLNNQ